MKKLFCALALSASLLCSSVYATDVKTVWDANRVEDQVIGYNIYDNGSKVGTTSSTTYTFQVVDGDHSFTVTAYNKNGESGQSVPVTKTIFTALPGTPNNVIITIIINNPS